MYVMHLYAYEDSMAVQLKVFAVVTLAIVVDIVKLVLFIG